VPVVVTKLSKIGRKLHRNSHRINKVTLGVAGQLGSGTKKKGTTGYNQPNFAHAQK
jgi:hypothetical protein